MPDKAKRAKPKLPDWAKNPEKYQYKKGSGVTDKKNFTLPSKIEPESSYYNLRKKNAVKKVLTTEW